MPAENRGTKKLLKARQILLFLIITFTGAALDIFTKWLAFSAIDINEEITVISGLFALAPTTNAGAAFGLMSGRILFFIIISILALVFITGYVIFLKHPTNLLAVALGLIAAGVLGNFFDRVALSGVVRDFLYFHVRGSFQWPTFNAADACITVGVALAVINAVRKRETRIKPEISPEVDVQNPAPTSEPGESKEASSWPTSEHE